MPTRPMVRPAIRLATSEPPLAASTLPPIGDARRILASIPGGRALTASRPMAPKTATSLLSALASTPGLPAADALSLVLARLRSDSPSDLDVQAAARLDPTGAGGNPPSPLIFTRTRRKASALPPPPPAPSPILPPTAQSDLADQAEVGAPLAEEHRTTLEPVIGANLRDVRIHTGEFAAAMASRLSAEAFTVGRDVYFGRGRFEPGTPRGRALLAHELVHVRQQTSQGRRIQRYGGIRDSAEAEAEQVERGVMAQAEQPTRRGLSVGAYVRNYSSSDGSAVQPRDRARLNAISARALTICEQSLGPLLVHQAEREIRNLEVAVTLDLNALGDEQAAEAWARSMADAVRLQLG